MGREAYKRLVGVVMIMNDSIQKAKLAISNADAIVIGAGAGLSSAAGFTYSGERFQKYFGDIERLYGFHDMYSGGFYPYETAEKKWAVWSRNIYINRYMDAPKPVYKELLKVVKDKEYFVITTNVDHCFQKAGIDHSRLFYTQGDYGLFQCSVPCHNKTYDNEETIKKMVQAQGYEFDKNGDLTLTKGISLKTEVPSELIQYCPVCGEPMELNLRSDNTFVQDDGWDKASQRYDDFLKRYLNTRIVFLEVGVGYNTPTIIKIPFWKYTLLNESATYICINNGQTTVPSEIESQSICIDGDAAEIISRLK